VKELKGKLQKFGIPTSHFARKRKPGLLKILKQLSYQQPIKTRSIRLSTVTQYVVDLFLGRGCCRYSTHNISLLNDHVLVGLRRKDRAGISSLARITNPCIQLYLG
jgi:hypothetical protein